MTVTAQHDLVGVDPGSNRVFGGRAIVPLNGDLDEYPMSNIMPTPWMQFYPEK